MTLKWLFFPKIAKITQRLGALPPDPRPLNCIILLNMPPKLQHFFHRIMLTFGSNPLAKAWLQLLGFILSSRQWIRRLPPP